MIRPARLAEVPAIVALAETFYARACVPIPFDAASFTETVTDWIDAENMAVLVSDDLKGCIIMAVSRCVVNHGVMIGQELFLLSEGGAGQKLLKAGEEWAAGQGATFGFLTCPENEKIDAMTRVYRRAGYAPTERYFVRAL